MGLWEEMDRRIKRFSIIDEKFAQLAAIFFALIIVKNYPHLLDYNIWWYVGLLVVCAYKPIYVFYFEKKQPGNIPYTSLLGQSLILPILLEILATGGYDCAPCRFDDTIKKLTKPITLYKERTYEQTYNAIHWPMGRSSY